MTAAVAIFVKTPGHSPVKTRLAAGIGPGAAVAFHELSARAVAEVASALGPAAAPCWAIAEPDAMTEARWLALPAIWQGHGDLGTRLHQVHSRLLAVHDAVLLLGADAPQVAPELLHKSLAAIANPATPFAMGESADGGFWLFGGRVPVPREVWCNVRYSQPDTAAQLRTALAGVGRIADLPPLIDVDEVDDLASVAGALAALPAPLPAQRALARKLERWLERIAA